MKLEAAFQGRRRQPFINLVVKPVEPFRGRATRGRGKARTLYREEEEEEENNQTIKKSKL